MAKQDLDGTVSSSYRITPETKQKISEIMENKDGTRISAEVLFTAFLSAYHDKNFLSTDYGQAKKADLDSWTLHIVALQQLYEGAIRSGMDAQKIVKNEMIKRIEVAEEAVSRLKVENENLKALCNNYSKENVEQKEKIDELKKQADKAEDAAEKAQSNADTWKESINTLTSQLKENREKLASFDNVKEELTNQKAQNAALLAENSALKKIIDQYFSK